MRRNSIIILLCIVLPLNLHGGSYSTKSMPLWKLQKYKYTTLLRTEPLSWCPYKSYLLVEQYVHIDNHDNKNWLTIEADLIALTKADADYNRKHAPKYKGTTLQKVRKIYWYCMRTAYVPHKKTARDVIQYRQGDCAGVASAFYVLCKKNHIPVRYVIGYADGECHAWNRVKIKGKWYWIDATVGLWLNRSQYKSRSVMEKW